MDLTNDYEKQLKDLRAELAVSITRGNDAICTRSDCPVLDCVCDPNNCLGS